MEKSPSNWIYYIAAKTTTSSMKRNEKENKKNKENAVRLIVQGADDKLGQFLGQVIK